MGHPPTSTYRNRWATMNHPDGPPRGSVAKHLQHACRNGDLNPDTIPTSCLTFIAVLLAPIHGHNAAVATSHHHDKQQSRLTLYVKDRPDTAPPTPSKPPPTDAGGLLSHKKDLFGDRRT